MVSRLEMDRLAAALVAVLAWACVLLRVWIVVGSSMARGWSFPDGLLFVLSYFTIETNFLVAIVATACALTGRHEGPIAGPRMLGAAFVYIIVVGVIYAVLLAGLRQLDGLAYIVDIGLHKVVPVLFALYWLAFAPKGRLAWRDPLLWLAYPLVYVVYSLLYGALTGRYLYPFSNVPALGYARTFGNAGAILLAFYLLGLILVTADRALAAGRRVGA